MMDKTEQASQIYARALYPLRRGCALWVPEPNEDLPSEYREAGLQAGDVGVLRDEGCYDFAFNACRSSSDPVNQGGVPDGFQQLTWNGSKRTTPHYFPPGDLVLSAGAELRNLEIEASARLPGIPVGGGAGFRINFARDQGAVIFPPNGAHSVNSRNLAVSTKPIAGRMQFTAIIGKNRTSRHSPPNNNGKHNQALFIRGFRISFRRKLRAFLRGSTVEVTSTYESSWRDVLGKKGTHCPFGRGRSSSSGSGSPSLSLSTSGASAETSFACSASGSLEVLDEVGEASCVLDDSSDTSIEEDDFVPLLELYHPLDVINDYILRSVGDDVKVVITHDDDWVALLVEEDLEMPDDPVLIKRVQKLFDITVNDGCASLTPIQATITTSWDYRILLAYLLLGLITAYITLLYNAHASQHNDHYWRMRESDNVSGPVCLVPRKNDFVSLIRDFRCAVI
ncbi:hypothetical protein E1B28_003857 [Marasmius oreades]|uniref:Uncharacterized protein n=1 Tax=Marasmius oreades TaxID=181124 RepID=A0A9P8AC18_9AGAR|nr:uncharacterized protein E1B28_003857 [Marasmius oreades]KAG7096418.1 hypothetical protein E1B28_003857 [Marasmius oreades]